MQREQPRRAPGPAGSSTPNTILAERHLCDIWAVLEVTSPFLAPSRSLPGFDPFVKRQVSTWAQRLPSW